MNTPTQTTRAIRIHITFSDKAHGRALRQVVGGRVQYVGTQDEADLVLFDNVRDVESGFNKDKSYAYLPTSPGEKNRPMPSNVVVIPGFSLVKILEVISAVCEELGPDIHSMAKEIPQEEPEVEFLPDARSILVIEDTEINVRSAKKGLLGHRLTIVTSYEGAMEILAKEKFEVVLTDLHLPMSSKTMGDKFKLGELVPYGILLMIEAARQGAIYVAVVTDLSHHDDPFSAAFDRYARFPIRIQGAKVRMIHAHIYEGAKDWASALRLVTED